MSDDLTIRKDDPRRVTAFASHLHGPERERAIGKEIVRLQTKRWPLRAIAALLGLTHGTAREYAYRYRRGLRDGKA